MKSSLIIGGILALFSAGCASAPVALPAVGPNPARSVAPGMVGQLEVFSVLQTRRDGNNYTFDPAWHQHADYDVYNAQGERMDHVFNTVSHYGRSPRLVTLPPGVYVVKARAQGYAEVDVPVVIERGQTTKVHLDAEWSPPPATPAKAIVSAPSGYPVGWRVAASNGKVE